MADESPIIRVPDGVEVNALGVEVTAYQLVSFRYEALENPAASARAGRKVFDRILMLRTHYAGSRDTLDRGLKRYGDDGTVDILDMVLWDKFGEIAAKYEANTEALQSGTPLGVLNLDVAAEATLRAVAVTTIEALAAVPDAQLRNLGNGGRELRERARNYLAAVDSAAPLAKAEAERDAARAEAEALRDEVKALRAELADARVIREQAPPRRRGKEAA